MFAADNVFTKLSNGSTNVQWVGDNPKQRFGMEQNDLVATIAGPNDDQGENPVAVNEDVRFTIEFNIPSLLFKGNIPEKTTEIILVDKYR